MSVAESVVAETLPTVIDAARPASAVSLAELWQRLDLLLILAQRDLTVRYRQAVIGIGWAVLRPVVTVAIFVTFFGLLRKVPSTGTVPYAASAMVGYLGWQVLATLIAVMTESLVNSRQLLTKVYFPRVLIPLSGMAVGITDYLVAQVPAAALLWWLGIRPNWPLMLAPLWLAGLLATAISVGLTLSALNARYRDVGQLVPFLLQLGFFVCPVIYETAAIVPAEYRWLYYLNPIAVWLDGLRWSMVSTPLPGGTSIAIAAGLMVIALWQSWRLFHHLDANLADRI